MFRNHSPSNLLLAPRRLPPPSKSCSSSSRARQTLCARPPLFRADLPTTTHIAPCGVGGIMRFAFRGSVFIALSLIFFVLGAFAQLGNSGSIEGVVRDPSGAAIGNATVEIKD